MAMYQDAQCIIDTKYIIAAYLIDGRGAADGEYAIALLLGINGTSKRIFLEYPSEQARDTAFAALRALVASEAGVGEEDV